MIEGLSKQELQELWITRHIASGREPRVLFDIGVGPKSEARTLKKVYPKMKACGAEPLLYEYANMYHEFPGDVLPVAIGAEVGSVTIHYNPENLLDASSARRTLGQSAEKEALMWTLDRFDDYYGNPKRVLLWMDIEGMELEALRGGSALLASHRVRWINIEERREDLEGWPRPEEIRELLAGYGYVRIQEYNKHPLHQDVIYKYKDEK